MSSEVCPHCGKTYKRLKSHLPHCKAAASSKTPPTKHDTASQASSSPHLASSDPTATQTLSMMTNTPTKKSKNVPAVSSNTLLRPSQSPASLPVATKKKQKLSEQIKTANISSSPTVSKPKKQSLRALIEAAKAEKLPSGSASFVEIKTNPEKSTSSADSKPASKIKTSKTKKALPTARDASKVKESAERRPVRDKEGEAEDLSVNQLFSKTGSGYQARITLQDVKATLGRANAARQPSRPSILTQIRTSDDNKIVHPKPAAPLLSAPLTISSRNERLLAVSSSPTELSSSLPAATLRGDESPNTADKATRGLAQRRLGQVRLKELPAWLACKTPTRPRDVMETIQRGWRWYYKKYIDVKKGGVGGPGMLLAGYCVLSYMWSYPHIKHDRWRKYH